MKASTSNVLVECLRLILRPIVGFCLRRSLTIQDFLESAKVVYIDMAAKEIEAKGEDVTISRIRVMTGIHRRDVMRIYREGSPAESSEGFVTKLIGKWSQDKRYLTASGKPKILTFGTEDSDFAKLVHSISKDVRAPSVLFELERMGTVKHVPEGLKLVTALYFPKKNPKEGFKLLSRDSDELLRSVEENMFSEAEIDNLHATAQYDNISQQDLPALKKWLIKEGGKFIKKVSSHLAKYDLDINPRSGKEGGGKVTFGVFGRGIEPPKS